MTPKASDEAMGRARCVAAQPLGWLEAKNWQDSDSASLAGKLRVWAGRPDA